ncbi:hypothetical protein SAMN05421541_13620 [Actinoplanes philippinensis]|uniref:DUF11 domain-containing protein n=1 Tax=Actinoplanes philippinensis TaxID=35752 RepID=A0A1I2N152_9ACTN|nr:hypothetical protein SAMN05421541_13620 [Actinoplanes philippinensis]
MMTLDFIYGGGIRVFKRTGIAALFFASLLLTPTAALAAPADGLTLELYDVTAAIGSTDDGTWVILVNTGDEAIDLPEVRLTADAGDLAGKAVIDGGSYCSGDGSTLTCTYPAMSVRAHGYEQLPKLFVRPTEAAQAGDTGTVKIAVGEATGTINVTIAEVVSLVAEPEVATSGAPGSTVTFAPGITNAGDKPIQGIVFDGGAGSLNVDFEHRFSNCRYAPGEFYCTLDEVLEPGKTYVPAEGVPLKIRRDAPAPMQLTSGSHVQTVTDAARWLADFKERNPVSTAGTGGPLRLVEKPAARAARAGGAQTDPEWSDDYTSITVDVTGENLPDEAAVGASARGRVGTEVDVQVGLRNRGPARIDAFRMDVPVTYPSVSVVIPAGATVVSYDEEQCYQRAADSYHCQFRDLEVGQKLTVPFRLRIDSAGTSTGSVTVTTADYSGTPGPDSNRGNNTAKLTVTGRA